MRVISRRKLREFWSKHGDAQTGLLLWYQRTTDAQWQNLADVRRVFPFDAIIDQPNITQDDKDYLEVLGTLVYDYEQKHEPMPVLEGIELLKALMGEENLQPCDLISIFEDESTIAEVLDKKQELTAKQIQKLGDFFQLSPIRFLASE